jgi:hypothetical protein
MAYDFNMNDLTDRQRAAVAMDGAAGLRALLYGGRSGGFVPDMFGGGNVQTTSGATDKGLWDLAENERYNYARENGSNYFIDMFAGADDNVSRRERNAGRMRMDKQARAGIGQNSVLRPSVAGGSATPISRAMAPQKTEWNIFEDATGKRYADGKSISNGQHTFGMVQGPGGPKQDSVGPAALPASGEEAYLSDGEAVLPAKTVDSLNNQFFGGDDNGVEKYTLATNQPFKRENQSDLRRRIDGVGGPGAVEQFKDNYLSDEGYDMKNKSKLRKYADGLSTWDSVADWATKKLGGRGYPQEYLDQLSADTKAQEDRDAAAATRAAAGNYNESTLKSNQEKARGLDTTNIGGVLANRSRRIDELSGYSDGKKLAPKKNRLGLSALRKMAV